MDINIRPPGYAQVKKMPEFPVVAFELIDYSMHRLPIDVRAMMNQKIMRAGLCARNVVPHPEQQCAYHTCVFNPGHTLIYF